MAAPSPALDPRLEAVLALIAGGTHADIGSDHAHLPIRAVQAGRVTHCLAIELNEGPYQRAAAAIARYGVQEQVTLRRGNGFEPLAPQEASSASICGMGAHTIRQILRQGAEKVPPHLILQPNDSPLLLRLWAREAGYHLRSEQLIAGYWPYPVLELQQAHGPDPAYLPYASTAEQQAALRYGPHLLQQGGPLLQQVIATDLQRLAPVAQPDREAWHEYQTAQQAMMLLSAHASHPFDSERPQP